MYTALSFRKIFVNYENICFFGFKALHTKIMCNTRFFRLDSTLSGADTSEDQRVYKAFWALHTVLHIRRA